MTALGRCNTTLNGPDRESSTPPGSLTSSSRGCGIFLWTECVDEFHVDLLVAQLDEHVDVRANGDRLLDACLSIGWVDSDVAGEPAEVRTCRWSRRVSALALRELHVCNVIEIAQ